MHCPPTTSVVVVARDPAQQIWLARCLSFLMSGSVPPDQVVVVVDEQPAFARRLADRFDDPRVIVLESQGAGWAAAWNTGLAWSSGDIVAFLQDDSTVDAEWLDRVVDALKGEHVVAAAANTEAFYPEGVRPLPDELLWLIGLSSADQRLEGGHNEQILSPGTAFRRNALVDAGGLPPRSRSDANTSLVDRLISIHGYDAVTYVPTAIVNQFVSERSTSSWFLARAAWRSGRAPVSAIALHFTALRHLARRRPREAGQCASAGLALALPYRLRISRERACAPAFGVA